MLLLVMFVVGTAGSISANAKSRMYNEKFENAGQSLQDTNEFDRKFIEIKGIFFYLLAPLVSPWDIEPRGGGNPEKKIY